jgi:hypothetical protein
MPSPLSSPRRRSMFCAAVVLASLGAGALAALAKADVLVHSQPPRLCLGKPMQVGVWYQSYSGGPRWFQIEIYDPERQLVLFRRGIAATSWKYWTYVLRHAGTYRTLYTVPGGRSIEQTSVRACGGASVPSASAVTDCGYWDGLRWTSTPQAGFGYHLTTRGVACSFARSFSRRYRGTDTFYPTWTCREINQYESFDIRCVSGQRVIRWVGGD